MTLSQVSIEILNGCRAVTALTPTDFAAILGLARGMTPQNGGTTLDVTPKGIEGPVRVYAIAREGRFLVGLRADFERLGLGWGRACDRLDTLRARQRPTG